MPEGRAAARSTAAGWERHLQSLVLTLISAAVLWAARSISEAAAQQAALVARIEALSAQVARLEGHIASNQQQYVTRNEFAGHEQRLQSLEQARKGR